MVTGRKVAGVFLVIAALPATGLGLIELIETTKGPKPDTGGFIYPFVVALGVGFTVAGIVLGAIGVSWIRQSPGPPTK